MDAAVFIERPNDNNKVVNGHRWRIFRLLFNINWTSCLIGLVAGCIVTVYLTLALMLIILPYIQGSCSYKGNHIWSSYGEWEWEPCSVTCGHGLQMGQRSRKCISDIVCTGNETETLTRQCTSEHCKVDGQWSTWNAHGTCSVTCGVGILQQYRECTNPSPENGGKSCDGERLRKITCNTKDCCPNQGKGNDIFLNCEGGWIRNDMVGACYCFSTTTASWENAQTICKQKNAMLASIWSSSESNWVIDKTKLYSKTDTWIGGKLVNDKPRWFLPGRTAFMNFTYWAPNEPKIYQENYICVQLWKIHDFKWDDYDCDYKQGFICKAQV